ncbi:MAG: YdcF family protein [Saprospiraceae bacterium]|nr:YdcF family protein [Saprospiraceae bacterium]
MSRFFLSSAILALFLSLAACSFSSKATRRMLHQSQKNGPYDLVVVPGVPFENGSWSQVMKIRILWSKYLYDKGIAKNVMYSGSSVASPFTEATIMALYAEALGIPRANIFTETKAEHSTENIYYSYKLAHKLGFRRVALASDPFQTKMLKKFTRRKVSPDVGLIPMVFDSVRVLEAQVREPHIDPMPAFVKEFVPLSERENFWQRLQGTRGRRLDAEAYK